MQSENSIQRLFYRELLYKRQVLPRAARVAAPSCLPGDCPQLPPWGLHPGAQSQDSIASNCAFEHLCFILIYSVYQLARCVPKVIAPSFYIA